MNLPDLPALASPLSKMVLVIFLANKNYATFLILIISSFFLKERDLNLLLSLILS